MGSKRRRAGGVLLVLAGVAAGACDAADATTASVTASQPAAIASMERGTSGARTAAVSLPVSAAAPFRIADATSDAFVEVALVGARDVAAAHIDRGGAVFRGAHSRGGDVVYRVRPDGVEDFVAFDAQPDVAEVLYDVALGPAVAGLRLVGGVLEMLDATGAPRLRAARPYVVGADGDRADATLAVSGCRVDRDPRAPWGRAVTSPGASRCAVRVTWDARGVRYPAVVDPVWTTTGSMADARSGHHAGLFAAGALRGKAMVVGGNGSGPNPPASAELYDPTSGTWAMTGGLPEARSLASVTWLADGRVLIAGGTASGSIATAASLYDPSTGIWAPTGSLAAIRFQHTASLLPNGKVIVAGGTDKMTPVITTTEVYDPAAGTWSAGPPTASGHVFHTGTTLGDGRFLLVGGGPSFGGAIGTATEVFDPIASTWTTLASPATPRTGHTATLLASGHVLVTGGVDGAGMSLGSAESFDVTTGKWTAAGSLPANVQEHAAVALAPGKVLVTGGTKGGPGGVVQFASIFDEASSTWTAAGTMMEFRVSHTATLLAPNAVLIAGGMNQQMVVATAEIFKQAAPGVACMQPFDCASGFCVSGVCCESACTGACNACAMAKKVSGADGVCGPAGGNPCSGFACTMSGDCKNTCAADADCTAGFKCDTMMKACLPTGGSKCKDDHTLTTPGAPDKACSPFICEGSACKTSCASVTDCIAPFVCGRDLQCVSLGGNSGGGGGGCAASPTSSRGAIAGLVGLGLALGLRLRRRCKPR